MDEQIVKINDNEDSKLYEIDINKKYVLAFDDFIPNEAWERIKNDIDNWLKSDKPFMLLRGAGRKVRLVKIEEEIKK